MKAPFDFVIEPKGNRYNNIKKIDGKDLRSAIDSLLTGKKISSEQFPSMGCNIKWK